MPHWTEDVFVDRPAVFRPALTAETAEGGEEVAALLELLAAEHDLAPETVLDVPCGVGRHAIPLAERGVAVTGVDISGAYLAGARRRAAEAGVHPHLLRGDMRALPVAGPFDLVVNLWTSFGYYDEPTDRAVLRALRERVAEGGALVLELSNKEGTMANFEADSVVRGEDHLSVETREYDPATSRMHTERDVFSRDGEGYDHIGRMSFDVRLFAPADLRRWLRDAGFGDVSLYADLGGAPLAHDSTRLVAVARP